MPSLIRIVVGSLEKIASFCMVALLLMGLIIGGYSNGFFGAILGLIISLVLGVMIFGMLFLFIEMNKNILKIRELLEKKINNQ